MEKDLNKELAELLGIKPITTDYCPKSPIDCDGHCGNCEEGQEIEVYPDFTKPINFVKILELNYQYTKSVITGSATVRINLPNVSLNKKSFIVAYSEVIQRLLLGNGVNHELAEYLKQHAKQVDWVY